MIAYKNKQTKKPQITRFPAGSRKTSLIENNRNWSFFEKSHSKLGNQIKKKVLSKTESTKTHWKRFPKFRYVLCVDPGHCPFRLVLQLALHVSVFSTGLWDPSGKGLVSYIFESPALDCMASHTLLDTQGLCKEGDLGGVRTVKAWNSHCGQWGSEQTRESGTKSSGSAKSPLGLEAVKLWRQPFTYL